MKNKLSKDSAGFDAAYTHETLTWKIEIWRGALNVLTTNEKGIEPTSLHGTGRLFGQEESEQQLCRRTDPAAATVLIFCRQCEVSMKTWWTYQANVSYLTSQLLNEKATT